MNQKLYAQMLQAHKGAIADRAMMSLNRSPVSSSISDEQYYTDSSQRIRSRVNKFIPGGAYGQLTAAMIPNMPGLMTGIAKMMGKTTADILGDTIDKHLMGPLGVTLQAIRPSTASRIEDAKAMRTKQNQMSGLEAGMIGSGSAATNLRRLLYAGNFLKMLGTGSGHAISSMFTGPLGLALMGTSLAGSFMKARVNRKINAQRSSLSSIEKKSSLSAQLLNQVNPLVTSGQINAGDQVIIQLLGMIEAHTSVTSLIYDEMDFIRQEKEKGSESAVSGLDDDLKGRGHNLNPVVKAVNFAEDSINKLLLSFDPFTQFFNMLGGKSPKRALSELNNLKSESFSERKELNQQALTMGINVQDQRLLTGDVTSLIRGGSYEEKMFNVNLIQAKLLKIIASESVSMRKGMGLDNEYKNSGEVEGGILGQLFSGIGNMVTNIPGINALTNVGKLLVTWPQKMYDQFASLNDQLRHSLLGSEFMRLQNKDEMNKSVGRHKPSAIASNEFVAYGLPTKLEDQKILLEQLVDLTERSMKFDLIHYSIQDSRAARKNIIYDLNKIPAKIIERELWSASDQSYMSGSEFDKAVENRTKMAETTRSTSFMKGPLGKLMWFIDFLTGRKGTEESRMYRAIDLHNSTVSKLVESPLIGERFSKDLPDFAAQDERNRALPSNEAYGLKSIFSERANRDIWDSIPGRARRSKRSAKWGVLGGLGGLGLSIAAGPLGMLLGLGAGLFGFGRKEEELEHQIFKSALDEHGDKLFPKNMKSTVDEIQNAAKAQQKAFNTSIFKPEWSEYDDKYKKQTVIFLEDISNTLRKGPIKVVNEDYDRKAAAKGGRFKIGGHKKTRVLVGEEGPELLDIHNSKIDVHDTRTTQRMLKNGVSPHFQAAEGINLEYLQHMKNRKTDNPKTNIQTKSLLRGAGVTGALLGLSLLGPTLPVIGPFISMMAPSMLTSVLSGVGTYLGGMLGAKSSKSDYKYRKAQQKLFEEQENEKAKKDPNYRKQEWSWKEHKGLNGRSLLSLGMMGGEVGSLIGGVPGMFIGSSLPLMVNAYKMYKTKKYHKDIDDQNRKKDLEKLEKLKAKDFSKLTINQMRLLIADKDYQLWSQEQSNNPKQNGWLTAGKNLFKGATGFATGQLLGSGAGWGLMGAGTAIKGLAGLLDTVGLTGFGGSGILHTLAGFAGTAGGMATLGGIMPFLLPVLGATLGIGLPWFLNRRRKKKEDKYYKSKIIKKLMMGEDLSSRFGHNFVMGRDEHSGGFTKEQMIDMHNFILDKELATEMNMTDPDEIEKLSNFHNTIRKGKELPPIKQIFETYGINDDRYSKMNDVELMNHVMMGGGKLGDPRIANIQKLILSKAPPRAKGGPVSPGKTYVVGEKKPEYFVPEKHGEIKNGDIFEKMSAQLEEIKEILEEMNTKKMGLFSFSMFPNMKFEDIKKLIPDIKITFFPKMSLEDVKKIFPDIKISLFSNLKADDIKNWFKEISFPNILFGLPKELFKFVWSTIKDSFKGMWSLFKFPFSMTGKLISALKNMDLNIFPKDMFKGFGSSIGKFLKFTFYEGPKKVFETMGNTISKLYTDMKSGLSTFYTDMKTGFSSFYKDMKSGIAKVYDDVKGFVTFRGIRKAIGKMFGSGPDVEESIQRGDWSDENSWRSENIYWLQRIHARLDRLPKKGIITRAAHGIGNLITSPIAMLGGMASSFMPGGLGGGMKEQLGDLKQEEDSHKWNYFRDIATEWYELELKKSGGQRTPNNNSKKDGPKDSNKDEKSTFKSMMDNLGKAGGGLLKVLGGGLSVLGTVLGNPYLLGGALVLGGAYSMISDAIEEYKKSGSIWDAINAGMTGKNEISLADTMSTVGKWASLGGGVGMIAGGPLGGLVGGLLGAAIGGTMEAVEDCIITYKKDGMWAAIKQFLGGDKEGGLSSAFKVGGTYALAGAAAGSFIPGIGTLAGGILGAAIGGIVGWLGLDKLSDIGKTLAGCFTGDTWVKAFDWKEGSIAYKATMVGRFLPPFGLTGLIFGFIGSIIDDLVNYVTGGDKNKSFFGSLWDLIKEGLFGGTKLAEKVDTKQLQEQTNTNIIGSDIAAKATGNDFKSLNSTQLQNLYKDVSARADKENTIMGDYSDSGRYNIQKKQIEDYAKNNNISLTPSGIGGPDQGLPQLMSSHDLQNQQIPVAASNNTQNQIPTQPDKSSDEGEYAGAVPQVGQLSGVGSKFYLPTLNARLTSPFGPRQSPTHGASRWHRGIDLAAPMGTPIYAASDGTVTYTGPANGYGQLVEITHPNGVITRYGHVESYTVKAGDNVKAGEQIALMGNRGVSTGPHVHFEVVKDGKHIDPQKIISGKLDHTYPGTITASTLQSGSKSSGNKAPIGFIDSIKNMATAGYNNLQSGNLGPIGDMIGGGIFGSMIGNIFGAFLRPFLGEAGVTAAKTAGGLLGAYSGYLGGQGMSQTGLAGTGNSSIDQIMSGSVKIGDGYKLGDLATTTESRGNPGLVGPDAKGASYGAWQMYAGGSNNTPLRFLKSTYGQPFASKLTGTDYSNPNGTFANQWRQLAKDNPEQFKEAQRQFILDQYLKPAYNAAQQKGMKVNSNAVNELLMHSEMAGTVVRRNLLASVDPQKLASDDPKVVLQALQDASAIAVPNGYSNRTTGSTVYTHWKQAEFPLQNALLQKEIQLASKKQQDQQNSSTNQTAQSGTIPTTTDNNQLASSHQTVVAELKDTGGWYTGQGPVLNMGIPETVIPGTKDRPSLYVPHGQGYSKSSKYMKDLAAELLYNMLDQAKHDYQELKTESESTQQDNSKTTQSNHPIIVDNKKIIQPTTNTSTQQVPSSREQESSSQLAGADINNIIMTLFNTTANITQQSLLNHPFGSNQNQTFNGSVA